MICLLIPNTTNESGMSSCLLLKYVNTQIFIRSNAWLSKLYCKYSNAQQTSFITEANIMDLDRTALSGLGLFCLQYSPPKYISRRKSRKQLSLKGFCFVYVDELHPWQSTIFQSCQVIFLTSCAEPVLSRG